MSEIYLLRHGQASFGKEDYDQLSDKGYAQAKLLSEFLISTGIKFDSFYLGENKRHRQTMEPSENLLKDSENLNVRSAFNEFEFEDVLKIVIPKMIEEEPSFKDDVDKMFENNSNFQKVFEKSVFRWLDQPEHFDVINWGQFVERVRAELLRVLESEGPGKKIALFSSGGVIAAVVQIILNLSDKDALRLSWQILNASITRIKYNSDSAVLCSFNEAGFLAAESGMVTFR